MKDAAARAAEEIAGQDWMDAEYTTPEMMAASRASIACIIRDEYAARDAAVAELVAACKGVLADKPLHRTAIRSALSSLAALEGK